MTASQLSSARSWVLSPSLSMLPAEEQCSNSRDRLLMRHGEAPSVRTLRSRHTLQGLNHAHDTARKPGPLASYPHTSPVLHICGSTRRFTSPPPPACAAVNLPGFAGVTGDTTPTGSRSPVSTSPSTTDNEPLE